VYRFHGEPDEDKIATFIDLANSFGFKLGRKGEVTSKELNDFIQKLVGHPEQRALNQLLLRSMMQAVYSSENVGHYGLAAEEYLHFTSPIRRYPDLLVHRLLKAHWARDERKPPARELERQAERLEELAVQSSERERAAMLVERELVSFYSALLVQARIGEVFRATVAAVTDFGFFVQLDGVWVEGLVKAESVGFGARYDERRLALSYPDGKSIKVGQKLAVRLTGVNVGRRQIDFALESMDADVADLPASEQAKRELPRPRAGGRSSLLERIDQLKRERSGGRGKGGRAAAPEPSRSGRGGGGSPTRSGGKPKKGGKSGGTGRKPSGKGGKAGPRGKKRR
jgi:ribonuclease R